MPKTGAARAVAMAVLGAWAWPMAGATSPAPPAVVKAPLAPRGASLGARLRLRLAGAADRRSVEAALAAELERSGLPAAEMRLALLGLLDDRLTDAQRAAVSTLVTRVDRLTSPSGGVRAPGAGVMPEAAAGSLGAASDPD